MSATDSGGFRFLSHRRRGLLALPGVADSGTVSAAAVLSDGSSTAPVTLGVAGVEAVQSIDTTLVTRQYPRPGATDAESEFFPLVEFAVAELPWLLPTPTGPHGPLPWLCLVAVQVRDGVSLTGSGPGRLDALRIGDGARVAEELPDPAACALWAHAFAATAVHTEGAADPVELTTEAPLSGCRLLAPRRLQPQTSYLACLVPTLAAGALAGLGRSEAEVTAALSAPQPHFAWSPTDTSVELPVYLHWEFACGSAGDFESLARSLHEAPVDATFGTRPLDLGLAGAGMPVTSSTATVFRGALTAPGIPPQSAWPDAADADQGSVDTSLVREIGAAAALSSEAAAALPGGRPAVGPLLYARAAAGRGDVGAGVPATDWFDQLNRDPRARAAAGLGTRVLRRNAEDVMARAWAQVGQVEEANAVLRRLQMSRAVSASLHERHLSGFSAGRLIAVARPLLERVALPAAATGGALRPDALAAVAASALPAGSTWRGLNVTLRPGSRLGDVARGATGSSAAQVGSDAPGTLLTGLASGMPEPNVLPDGTISLAAPPSAVLGPEVASLLSGELRAAAAAAGLPVPEPGAAAAAGLDALATAAGHLSSTAAASLAAETGAVVSQRALPKTVTFSQLGGMLISQDQLHSRALEGPVVVHTLPAHSDATVLDQSASIIALSPAATSAAPRVSAISHTSTALLLAAHALATGPSSVKAGSVGFLAASASPAIGALGAAKIPAKTMVASVGNLPIATPAIVELEGTDARLVVIRDAYAQAVDRFLRPGMAPAPPSPAGLDLSAARTALLANLQPAITVAALAAARVPALAAMRVPALAGHDRPDPVAPVMAGPVFGEAAYTALVEASHDALVPGLDSIPPDSVTLVQTNPTFVAAYLAGLNSALGHELLWRGYPTDERGTYWHSFWGAGPDIGPLHRFAGGLVDNVAAGTQPLLVLVLRGRLLRRYPDSDIYAVLAGSSADLPELDDGAAITRPLFRDFVAPDITLVGFPLTYEQMTGTGAGQGYWFVIAEHPGQPRFGLTDPDPASTHSPLPTWDELSWSDLGPAAAAAAYLPQEPPPLLPAGTTRQWGASAADMAAITYQPAVRIAFRARDLLRSSTT
jgi:hypothetical protein